MKDRISLHKYPKTTFQPLSIEIAFTFEHEKELLDFREELKKGNLSRSEFSTKYSALIIDIIDKLREI